MILLKIISWTDRAIDFRNKDAKDIAYLLSTYEIIPEVKESLYAKTQIMETYDWDITQAAACLLGQRARNIAKNNTVAMINALANEKLAKLNLELLVEEMCVHIENEFERKQQLLSAFFEGFGYK
jgi:predicted nucleotidyltransferase